MLDRIPLEPSMVAELLVWSLSVALGPPTPVPPPPDPRELELVWRAPAGCPTQADVERRLRELLPGEPTGEGVLHVEGEVTLDDGGARLILVSTFRGASERREIASTHCAELGEATAVLLAVALEPDPSAREPEPTPAAAIVEPPPPEITDDPVDDVALAPVVLPTTAPVPTRARRVPDLGLRIAGGVEVGALPPPSAAVQIAGLLLWRRARLEIHGTYLVPRARTDAAGQGARVQLGAAGVRGCGRVFAGAVEFPLCIGAEAGATRARALGLANTVARGPWVAAIASAGVARAWGPVAIWFAVEGLGRLVGTRFLVGESLSSRQFPVSARALVGIELRGSWNRGAHGQ